MTDNPDNSVCVIVAAKNAADTIAAAISSALADTYVTEVIVVDDGSTDGTSDAAREADDASGRLRIIRFDVNRGPSYARNHAISCSSAALISILDADDFFIPGRFSHLLSTRDWDMAADNIVFVDQRWVSHFNTVAIDKFSPETWFLDLPTFVDRNISRRNKQRGELGFLKPVIRREFLDRHSLRYNEKLRLGEDYDLYTRALALGARFQIINNCGYGAVVRADSLSGRHRTDDLKQLADADKTLLNSGMLSGGGLEAVREHERHIRSKFHHRQFLDIKSQNGLAAAAVYGLRNPSAVLPIARGILTDKFDGAIRNRSTAPQVKPELRYLFPATVKPQ
ncbi:glycosyltransferase family 2 protein [Phyllobacterium chamaecytisi]|uniref:glycosyltransferase family 2 protein n=1 Tax=Phyllobacterium chamaecytisi TaxID=2876082 RepID=UPI00351D7A2B